MSPLVYEGEGQEVKEELHQAWVLNNITRSQLENPPQDGSCLTRPSLMTDIKLVRGDYVVVPDFFQDCILKCFTPQFRNTVM